MNYNAYDYNHQKPNNKSKTQHLTSMNFHQTSQLPFTTRHSAQLHASHRSKAGQASLNRCIHWINTGSADGRWSADGVVEFVVVPEPLVQNSMANLRIFFW